MAEPTTFIKLDRNILNWGWYKDLNTFKAFVHCLLKASIKEKKFKTIELEVGEFVMGYEKFGMECGLTRQQVRTAINHLISTNELTIKSTNQGTIIKVVNFGLYQSLCNQISQPISQQINTQSTNDQPTTNQRLTTNNNNKNNKNERNIKEIYKEKFDIFWSAYPKKVSKSDAYKAFGKKAVDVDIQVLLDAIENQKKSDQWSKDNGQFIPFPSTWLNQERWNDETQIKFETKPPVKQFAKSIIL